MITATLAGWSAGLTREAVPADVRARARLLVLDLLGIVVRARHDSESTGPLLGAVRALGLAAGNAAVFGDSARYTPAGAALLNGALGHSLDFDDTHAEGTLHPGAPVIPAALAAGEMVRASGADVLTAIEAGYDVACRTALSLPVGAHYARGFHPTATCGAFGAAAAAARVFGLSAAETESALGIVLSQAAGSLQFLVNGAWTKRFQVGWSGMSGLVAATLAREGFKGATEALEGKHGFMQAHAPSPDPARAVQDLGTVWELMNTALKPYPSCRFGHAGIDAAIAFRGETGVPAERIERVVFGTSVAGMTLVGEPLAKRQDPRNVVDGQFSAPFVIAEALLTGQMGWDSYARLDDPAIRSLLPKVSVELDAEIDAMYPRRLAGRLTVEAEGRRWTRVVADCKGEPANFLTDGEVREKFMSLAGPILGERQAEEMAAAVLGLDELGSLRTLVQLAAPNAGVKLAGD